MTDDKIEQEIQTKGLTAPRITLADVEANIASEWYINAGTGVVPDDMPHGQYGCILADPPWARCLWLGNGSAQRKARSRRHCRTRP